MAARVRVRYADTVNVAHLHLMLNHLPTVGTGLGVLLLVYGIVRRREEVTRAALLLFILIALISIPTYLTGEPAGELVKKISGVSEATIERHDRAAEIALAVMELLGGLSLLGLLVFRRAARLPRWFLHATLLVAIVVTGLMVRTAKVGGQIRHFETGGAYVR